MQIRVTQQKRGKYYRPFFEVLCDHCRTPIANTEVCNYLTPIRGKGENLILHDECSQGDRSNGYWQQMYKPAYLLGELFDQYHNRHPKLTEFLETLPKQKTE